MLELELFGYNSQLYSKSTELIPPTRLRDDYHYYTIVLFIKHETGIAYSH